MIRALALCLLASPALADADPGPLPEMADVDLLRSCLLGQTAQAASTCRFRVFMRCAQAAGSDTALMLGCHAHEADTWEFILIEDAWPQAVAVAQDQDARQAADVNGFTGLEAALRATQAPWDAHSAASCALGDAMGESVTQRANAGPACRSEMMADRVLALFHFRDTVLGNQ